MISTLQQNLENQQRQLAAMRQQPHASAPSFEPAGASLSDQLETQGFDQRFKQLQEESKQMELQMRMNQAQSDSYPAGMIQ